MGFESITILGGRGMLGGDLAAVAAERGLSVRVFDLPEFDITDEKQAETAVLQSEVVVNCAAYTNVEKAESEVELANQVNGYAVGRLGLMAKEAGVPVLHISTDFVFDGMKEGPYAETDATNPVSAYGGSKLLGEKLLAESGCECCIVRVQWTYGKGGVNFVTKITEAAKSRDVVNVVDDQIGSPTHTMVAAEVLCDLLAMDPFPRGLYHLAAGGYVSRYEMTRYLFERLGIATKVQPCKTSDFKTAVQRPLNSRFDCTKLQTLLGRAMPSWQDMLKNYLENL
ncbi:MAG: dTDP-4-dehydrorhamnose reductase [Planctomycetota bacterium]|jgi:dTDP-4-dehydrorhamnose reductase